jgi:hypothetical protein
VRYGTVDKAFAMQLATCPPEQDGPVLMVNFMKYREQASYSDAGAPAISGREADNRYAPIEVLAAIGARPVLHGDVVDADGAPVPTWDRVGIVLYPTRRAFIEMQSRPDFQDKHVHKDAGMQFTIVMAATPTTETLASFTDPGRAERVVLRALAAADESPLGDHEARLSVEGTIIGDERRFAELRVAWVPADRALDVPAGGDDRDLFAIVRPMLDHLGPAISSWPQAGS